MAKNNTNNITITGTKVERKLAILINSTFNNVPVTLFTEASEIHFELSNGKTPFKQFEGNLIDVTGGKFVHTGAKWFWGLDKKFASPKFPFGTLYKEGSMNGTDGTPKVYITGRAPFVPYDIAKAVHEAFMKGEGVLTSEQVDQLRGQIVAPTKPAEPIKNQIPVVQTEADADEDLAILNSMGESPLDRLQAGDPTLFLELGAPQVYAEHWVEQIRNGSVSLNSIEDVSKIRGIGKVRAEKLILAWHEKFDA